MRVRRRRGDEIFEPPMLTERQFADYMGISPRDESFLKKYTEYQARLAPDIVFFFFPDDSRMSSRSDRPAPSSMSTETKNGTHSFVFFFPFSYSLLSLSLSLSYSSGSRSDMIRFTSTNVVRYCF
jgi:hypothetical protein